MLSGKFGWQLKKIKVLEDMNKIKKLVFSLFFFSMSVWKIVYPSLY